MAKKNREELRQRLLEEVDHGEARPSVIVKLYRKVLGKTQPEFAKMQGVSYEAVRQIENERSNPTLGLIQKMLRGSGLIIKIGRQK